MRTTILESLGGFEERKQFHLLRNIPNEAVQWEPDHDLENERPEIPEASDSPLAAALSAPGADDGSHGNAFSGTTTGRTRSDR